MIGKTIDELKIGDAAEFSKTVSESDTYLYAEITGDFNPAHINEDYAKKPFSRPVLPTGCCRQVLFPLSSEPSFPEQEASTSNKI